MKKKGAFNIIITGILGLLIILIALAIFPEQLWAPVKDIVSVGRGYVNDTTEFVPFETELSAEDVSVKDSMDALVYAINKVATKEKLEDKKFGDVEVTCNQKECTVSGFFLPQDTEGAEFFKPETWLAGYGDPRWLVYYEAFPDGADAYWHTDGKSIFNTMSVGFILAGGAMNIIPGGGKAAKLAKGASKEAIESSVKKVSKEATEEFLKKGGKEILERVVKNGQTNTIRGMFIEEGLKNIYGVGDNIAKETTEKILQIAGKKGGAQTFETQLKGQFEKELPDILSKITRKPTTFDGTIGQYREKVLRDIVDGTDDMIVEFADGEAVIGLKGIFSKSISKSMKKDIFSKKFTQSFFKQMITETGQLNEKLLRETAEKSITSLDAMSPTLREKALRKASTSWDGLLKGTIGSTREELKRDVTENFIGKPLREKLRYSVEFVADQASIKFAKPPTAIGTVASGGTNLGLWVAKTTGKSVANIPNWVLEHKYPIMLLVVLAAQNADAMSEKKLPVGENSLGLNQPTLFGLTNSYELDPEARKYFIALEDTVRINELKGRLYLVSPCKATLKIFKDKCTCNANPTLHRYDFGGGLQDIKANSVRIKENIESELKQKAADTVYRQMIANPNSALAGASFGFWERIVRGTLRPIRTQDLGKTIRIADQYFDTSEAIKECQPKGLVDGAVNWVGMELGIITGLVSGEEPSNFYMFPEYEVDCIKVQVEKEEYEGNSNYCYDAFPNTELIRDTLTLGQVGMDIYITGAMATTAAETGGLSLGAGTALLFGSGIGFGVVDEMLAHSQKWP